jgi:hypothetical protein
LVVETFLRSRSRDIGAITQIGALRVAGSTYRTRHAGSSLLPDQVSGRE